jgi:hypothetical protein
VPEIRPADGSRLVHRHEDRLLRSYAPSFFDGASPFLSPEHQGAEAAVADIRGKLEPSVGNAIGPRVTRRDDVSPGSAGPRGTGGAGATGSRMIGI